MSEPPKLATALLKRIKPDDSALAGDLCEAYRSGKSKTWIWSQVIAAGVCDARAALTRNPHFVIAAFFVLMGLAPQGVTVDLSYPLVRARLDFDYQYVGLFIAIGIAFRWRWGRFLGRLATWALGIVLATELMLTLVGMLSGTGSLHFAVLWPSLNGNSPVAFVMVAVLISTYLHWQSRAFGQRAVA